MLLSGIAEHEAGHLVAAWASGRVHFIESALATTTHGYVSYQLHKRVIRPTGDMWSDCVVSLAGVAANFRSGTRINALGIYKDLMQAKASAEAIARRVDVREAFPLDTSSRAVVTRMFQEEPPEAVKHVLEAAYCKAKLIISVYDVELRLLTRALLLFGDLDGPELRLIMGKKPRAGLFAIRRRGLSGVRWVRVARGVAVLCLVAIWRVFRRKT